MRQDELRAFPGAAIRVLRLRSLAFLLANVMTMSSDEQHSGRTDYFVGGRIRACMLKDPIHRIIGTCDETIE